MSFGQALTQAILPVLSVAVVGYVLGSVRDLDVDGLSSVTIYVLTPALVFHTLATTTISGAVALKLAAGVAAFILLMVAVAELAGRLAGEAEPVLGAVVLASIFPNAGNYGIPLSDFAFGEIGRSIAVLFIASQSVLMYTVGVYVASRGNGTSTLSSVLAVFKLPLVYAVIAAGLARALDAVPPADSAMMETVALTGDAAIPVMLLILGIQLANTDSGAALSRVGTATALKLVVAPLVGAAIALALGFGGTDVGRVFILECGMPAAITPLILAIEFNDGSTTRGVTAPEYVSTAILVTTVASVPLLAVLITLLQSGGFP